MRPFELTERRLPAIGAGAFAAVATAAAIQLASDPPDPVITARLPGGAAIDIATSAAWLAAGLVAWWRRPANRVGALMVAVGLAVVAPWVLVVLGAAGMTAAALIDELVLAVGAHLFLAFPDGRLHSRLDRIVIALAYLDTTIVQALEVPFRAFGDSGCRDCPENLLLISAQPAIADAVVSVVRVIALVLALALVVILAQRWRRATQPARRVLAPVLWSSLLVAALFGANYALVGTGSRPALAQVGAAAVGVVPVAFLVGLLRTRLRHGVVSDLVVELSEAIPPQRLREVIARALGDESLELTFWLPEPGHFVDAAGRPVVLRRDDAARGVFTIEHDGTPLAAMSYDASLLEDPRLLEGVAGAARLALENSRLHAELRAQLREVRSSRARIVAAGDAERRRIERDLHDGAQQRLLGVRMTLRLARSRRSEGPRQLEALLAEMDDELKLAVDDLRAIAHGLQPPVLAEEGLGPALAALVRRSGTLVEVAFACRERLPQQVETAAYYVAAEGIANAVKHAQSSRVRLELTRRGDVLEIDVTDDGHGGADAEGGGLRGLRDRVEALDGRFEVHSRPDEGTRLRARLPCA